MAHEKQHWKDALQAAKSERGGSDDRVDQREQKKKSRQHYIRRKLDKEVKDYVNKRTRINSRDIDAIGRKYGFQSYDLGEQPDRDRE